jgi:hypothetical protein
MKVLNLGAKQGPWGQSITISTGTDETPPDGVEMQKQHCGRENHNHSQFRNTRNCQIAARRKFRADGDHPRRRRKIPTKNPPHNIKNVLIGSGTSAPAKLPDPLPLAVPRMLPRLFRQTV